MTQAHFDAPSEELLGKYSQFKDYLKSLGTVAVAYSSGVDSTFLLYAASAALGENVIALTASSCLFPKRELHEATDYCKELGIEHFVVEADVFSIEGFSDNPPDRCYHCKRRLFERFQEEAKKHGITSVVEGSNLDDMGDYRPGHRAIAELGILSPLRKIGFTKQEIRVMSAYLGIPTAEKASFACLASRFPYGELISEKKLSMVDNAEQYLLDAGFKQFRVRIHGTDVARIEVLPEDFDRFMESGFRNAVYSAFKEYGFNYVSLDLKGYRTGSMNETLAK